MVGVIYFTVWLKLTPPLRQLEKFKKADFGRCPRVLCHGQPLLPVGLTDTPYEKSVKLYCGRCEDIYSPKSTRHGSVDGAFFGTSFPHMMYLVYPSLLPSKVRSSAAKAAFDWSY
jgi:Casein kinase II regulatory subunit